MKAEIPIDRLVMDEQYWPRIRRNDDRVSHLADLLRDGIEIPPVKIQRKTGLLLGGWHTVAAYQRLGRTTVPAEVVDVDDDARLLFAYREDVDAALPYTIADVRWVARRLYEQRSNGQTPNVSQLARDLGRKQQTVEDWLKDLIERDRLRQELERAARGLAAVMLTTGAKLSQRRVAALLGVSVMTVSRDTDAGNALQGLTDDRIISLARSLIAETAGRGSTDSERRAAGDWLLAQLNPESLVAARYYRALNRTLTWTGASRRQLTELQTDDLVGCALNQDDAVQEKRAELVADLAAITEAVAALSRRIV